MPVETSRIQQESPAFRSQVVVSPQRTRRSVGDEPPVEEPESWPPPAPGPESTSVPPLPMLPPSPVRPPVLLFLPPEPAPPAAVETPPDELPPDAFVPPIDVAPPPLVAPLDTPPVSVCVEPPLSVCAAPPFAAPPLPETAPPEPLFEPLPLFAPEPSSGASPNRFLFGSLVQAAHERASAREMAAEFAREVRPMDMKPQHSRRLSADDYSIGITRCVFRRFSRFARVLVTRRVRERASGRERLVLLVGPFLSWNATRGFVQRAYFSAAARRSSFFWIFPMLVFGSAETNST